MTATGDRAGRAFSLQERSQPDRKRVEEGLALLGRMVAQAYARDHAIQEGKEPPDASWIPFEEERRDAADD